MAELRITIPASIGAPDSPEAIEAADSAAAQKASAWTTPVYLGTDQDHHVYTVDAVPKTSIVTTSNIAPTLLPPHVL